jgi:hypothetical protein
MRAPAEAKPRPLGDRPLADIASDIGVRLGVPASRIERQLLGYKDPASGTVLGIKQMAEMVAGLPTFMTPVRKDFARERNRLQWLARKYRSVPFLVSLLNGAANIWR